MNVPTIAENSTQEINMAKATGLNLARLISDVKEFVSIPSLTLDSTACNNALHFLHAKLSQISGVTIETFERNGHRSLLAYVGQTRPEKFKVLLNGHVDVVDGPPEAFEARHEGEFLYGRGVEDMKTTALIFTELFCQLAPTVDYPLGLQLVSDEEIGGRHGTGYQSELGVRSEFTIGGEQTNFDINTSSKGVCWAKIHYKGQAAHGAYPWRGDNALVGLHKIITKLFTLYPLPEEEAWQTTVNISRIETENTTFNLIPEKGFIQLDFRYTPEDPRFRSREAAQFFMESLSDNIDVEMVIYEAAHLPHEESAYLKQFSKVFTGITGETPKLIRQHGGSDARYFTMQGDEAINFGLRGSGAHSERERVEIASIPEYWQIMRDFLLSLSKNR